MTHHEPTIASILRALAYEYQTPVEERQVLEQVLKRRPSSAKNPYATIRERLRWDGLTLGWLRLSRRELVPLHVILQGLRFRCLPRPSDLDSGLLPLVHLQPFAGLRSYGCTVRDETGALMPFHDPDEEAGEVYPLPAFDLRAFFARTAYQPGDSLLVTVSSTEPLGLTIAHEPAAAFRDAAVTTQDSALIAAINERVQQAGTVLVPCDEVILPIFATAAWRTAYPGTPWQHLVLRDPRLQLVDDIFLTNQRLGSLQLFGSDEVFAQPPQRDQDFQAVDEMLLSEIETLQDELHRVRQSDAEAGLWSGQVQRASATFGGVDEPSRGSHPLFGGRDEDLLDGDWGLDDAWEPGDEFDETTLDPNDPILLEAAHARMLEVLPAEAAARLQHARPEEAELIIAQHLNQLLVKAPELFPRIEIIPPNLNETSSPLDDLDSEDWPEVWDDEFDDEIDDEFEDEATNTAFAHSTDLIAQFRDYLVEMGKSRSTARARSRDLQLYADFLASYYGRTLAEGDYATLDECLFFYYPRRVLNTSPRQVRAICTAIKQLYAFFKQRGVIDDDRFAEALWRRRDQAVRVVEIYEQIASDSPNFELLFERLFQPYTE